MIEYIDDMEIESFHNRCVFEAISIRKKQKEIDIAFLEKKICNQ